MKNVQDEINNLYKKGKYKPVSTKIEVHQQENNKEITRITIDLEKVTVAQKTPGVNKESVKAVLQSTKTHPDWFGKQIRVGSIVSIRNDGKIGKTGDIARVTKLCPNGRVVFETVNKNGVKEIGQRVSHNLAK